MKDLKTYVVLMLFIFCGQITKAQKNLEVIRPLEALWVSDIKTTHLIFDKTITYVDLGSPYFVADTVQTLIKVRHIGEEIDQPVSQETNLTVITVDGAFHSIPLKYNRNTEELTYRIGRGSAYLEKPKDEIEAKKEKETEIKHFTDRLRFAPSNIKIEKKREDFGIAVMGIFYEKDLIALRLVLQNTSAIDLDIDQILFRLKLNKRISPDYIYQERILKPVHIVNDTKKIKGNEQHTMIMVFDKFTPNKNEDFVIDVLEKKGGRSARLEISRKKLINPETL
ncbi:DUF4138 domain-containing protein [Ascidiimonas sp. W6]|uniref:DUF4138 domain-containing protein n=1 Tax=Ascidiimonas meishanensis TaxID=3128903 RepID=UPI0030EC78F0